MNSHAVGSVGRFLVCQFRQMGGDGESRPACGMFKIPQPGTSATFEARQIPAEARALGRVGGEVGHGGKRMKDEG